MTSSDSFGLVGFIRVRPRCRWVHFGFIRTSVVWFIRARPCSRSVNSGAPWGSLGSFGHPLRVVGFTWVRWVHSGAPLGLSGSFALDRLIQARPGGHSVYLDAHLVTSGSFGFVELILAFPGRVPSEYPYGLLGSLGIVYTQLGCRPVHLCSL